VRNQKKFLELRISGVVSAPRHKTLGYFEKNLKIFSPPEMRMESVIFCKIIDLKIKN
jgi:hypothetical protein